MPEYRHATIATVESMAWNNALSDNTKLYQVRVGFTALELT